MTTELTVLTLAALLQVVQYMLYSVTANLQVGIRRAMGPRDEPIHLTGVAGRLQRALNTHFEGLILFGIAATVISVSGQSTPFTAICAHVYLIARILYIPAYASGAVPWRTLIWMAGFGATTLMLLAALL
jgi:uncharacterized MAPEG superfamily protein